MALMGGTATRLFSRAKDAKARLHARGTSPAQDGTSALSDALRPAAANRTFWPGGACLFRQAL